MCMCVLPPPVSVVEVPAKGDQTKWVVYPIKDGPPDHPVGIHALHFPSAWRFVIIDESVQTHTHVQCLCRTVIQLTCISPAKLLAGLVKGQAIGEAQIIFDQDDPIRAVHVGHLNLRPVPVPVCPVNPTKRAGDQ